MSFETTTHISARAPIPRRASVSDQIRELLRQRIVSLELEPGQSLSRTDLAAYYEVSQTPIRDAMLRLEAEGLLRIFPQARTLVSLIDVDHARETQFLRLSLELEVARTLCERPGQAPIEALTGIVDEMEAAAGASDMTRFTQDDARFHRTLFAATAKDALWDLVVERSGHIDRLRKLNLPDPGKIERILASHRQIVSGLAAQDVEETTGAVRLHLGETLALADQIVAAHPDYFRTDSPPAP
ncbi:GntR family transcriptional regulator [Roseicyclus sp. F158]|uniref:GntR family transcriptional regulator n=1 Tax=Tropicimonas omnivorans TaxID=3075590 RepID=A0ABU3DHJ8_9RHOB|nr:GntR family transcriptional regulator [Roseicyclus sp. F158]MDT0683198.1 GntR family transcriptional regulator [Roseicyclus sp. F158]